MSALAEVVRFWLGDDIERVGVVYLLVLARTVPLAWLSPWLGWRGTAAFVRVSVAVVLSAALTPLALAAAPTVPADLFAVAFLSVREALIGATFAVAASVPLYALGWTGDLLDGLRSSRAPSGAGPLGLLHLGVSVVLFVLLGGHRIAIRAFADGLRTAPPGAGVEPDGLADFGLGAVTLLGNALDLTLAFALPAIVAFVLLELAFGYAARIAPTLRTWLFGMPLRAALGVFVALLALTALVPHLGGALSSSVDAASQLFDRLRS